MLMPLNIVITLPLYYEQWNEPQCNQMSIQLAPHWIIYIKTLHWPLANCYQQFIILNLWDEIEQNTLT